MEVATTDYHTAGEPFRIVTAGAPEIPGASVRERREHARSSEEVDAVRRLLCHEPRGHADMYGCFLVPPDDDGRRPRRAVLAQGRLLDRVRARHDRARRVGGRVGPGRRRPPTARTDVTIDVPSGRVVARVRCARRRGRGGDLPQRAGLRARPRRGGRRRARRRRLRRRDLRVRRGRRPRARRVPERPARADRGGPRDQGARSRGPTPRGTPTDDRLSGIYGTILYDELGRRTTSATSPCSPTARSTARPAGSATSARLALLATRRARPGGAARTTRSSARRSPRAWSSGRADGVVTEIEGTAFRTGEHRFVLDPRDELGTGFVLR